jgi:cyclophilin family peptidyl-prolyl cis-trans isomerase
MLLTGVLAVLAQAATAAPAPPAAPPAGPKGPVVVITTNVGRIVVALDREKAPVTVKNFVQYVRGGHYDHTIFHRVIRRFMIQGGGYEADMSQHPLRSPIKNESLNGLSNRRGTIAMARLAAPDSATAQFFINLKHNRQLDGRPGKPGYTVFGEVVEGMDVVDRIAAVKTTRRGPHRDVPVTPIVIRRVREAPGWKPKPEPTPEPAMVPEAAPAAEPAPEAAP